MKLKFWKSKEKKESRVSSAIAGLFGGGVAWSERDYENFAKEVYLKNIIGYRCIDIIAKAVSSVPWGVFLVSEDGEKEHISHPISNRLKRTNPEESWSFFIYSSVSYLLLSGNSFLEKVTLSGGNDERVEELYNLRPDRVQILVDENTGIKKGYKYTAAGTPVIFDIDPITRESPILHIHLFHPTNDFWGASIVEPAACTIDTSNSATKWNKKLLDNEARPGMLLMFKELLGDKQFDRLSKQIREAREGAENAGKSLILEGATEAKPYGFNPAEMDFIKGNLELSRNICNAWGVPPQLVGIPDSNTYCLPEEVQILMDEGNKSIKDIKKGDIVYSLNTDTGEIEKKKVLWSDKVGNKKIYKIRTRNRMLCASSNHPVLIRNDYITNAPFLKNRNSKEKEYELIYKQVGDLKPGDILVQIYNLPEQNENKYNVTVEEMELFGFYMGDGWFSPPLYKSNENDKSKGAVFGLAIDLKSECGDYYIDIATKFFGSAGKRNERSICFYGIKYAKRFMRLGFGGNAHTKRVPKWIFKLNNELKLAFLRGLIDSDGSINNQGRMGISLCNEMLIEDIRTLCINCGLKVNNIRKSDRIVELPNKKKIRSIMFSFLITRADDVLKIGTHTSSYLKKIRKNLNKIEKNGLLTTKGKASKGKIEKLANIDFIQYATILEINELENKDVYDIEIEDNHNFIANGVIVHNSNYREARAALWEDTVIFYLTLYQGEMNNWFFGEESNIEINYVLDDVPALAYKRDKMWERAQQADFLSINEKRAMVQMDGIEGGDVVLVPASMIPLGAELPTEEEIEEDDEKAIKNLIDEGIGREEAEEMISG